MTDADSRSRIHGRTLIGEFLLIVAGVTVALGADSLWGVRLDRLHEAEYLAQLRADVAENQERLAFAIEQEEMQGAAALTAFRAVSHGEPITADSARAWLVERRGLYYSDPRLLTGTFSGIVESGDIRLIRSPIVRNAIIAYLPEIEGERSEFDRWVGILLSGTAPLRAAGVGYPAYAPSVGGPDVQVLANDPGNPAVLEALDSAIYANQVRLIYLRRMLEATDAIARALSG